MRASFGNWRCFVRYFVGGSLPLDTLQKGDANARKEARIVDQAAEDLRGAQEEGHEQDQSRQDQQRTGGEEQLTRTVHD
jgi:hypothetical protein